MPVVQAAGTMIYKGSVMHSLQHDAMIWNTNKNRDMEGLNHIVFSPSIKTIPFNCNRLSS